jgi:hypothetical protein
MSFPPGFDASDAVAQIPFVDAVYAAYERDKSVLKPAVALPLGYDLVAWIQMSDFWLSRVPQFYGIIAQKTADPGEHLVAFRGTDSALEWFNNAFAWLVEFKHAPNAGRTHMGFTTIYDSIRVEPAIPGVDALPGASFAEMVAAVVAQSSAQDSVVPTSMRLVGHSLGAALLTLYVVENAVKKLLPSPKVYTFASPRVGDPDFAAAYNGLHLPSWRIDNAPDIVPDMPPDLWYTHVDTTVGVDSSPYVRNTPACSHPLSAYRAALLSEPLPGGDCATVSDDAALALMS